MPLHDEDKEWQVFSAWNQARKAYDAEVIDTEPTKPLPSYGWTYRPEYQFSQFQLEIDSILREYTDESGQTHEQELLTEQLIDGKIPTIRSDDDLVSVFYSLVQQTVPRLTAIEGEQELVMSLGAHELKVTVTDTGEIRFDNLEQLDYLDPTDLLTIRLYLNHDAGNTLWEWAFTRNGLHVYYQVPGNTETRNGVVETDIEILSLLEPGEAGSGVMPVQDPVVRTLGGMRLRYRYIPPSLAGTEITYVDWTINKRGRYCQGYGVDDPQGQCTVVEAGVVYKQTNIPPGDTADVYWEPLTDQPAPPMAGTTNVDWSNWAGTQTADAGVEASLKAHYTIPSSSGGNRVPRTYEQAFHIKTRELRPDPADPMEGSDVAMLEAMLWQLGISPQYGANPNYNSGYLGARINSSRNGSGLSNWTQNCQGAPADNRGMYYYGWGAQCLVGQVSLEGMIRRFQARNVNINDLAGTNTTTDVSGIMNNVTLRRLQRIWSHYFRAVETYAAHPVFTYRQLPASLWADIEQLADQGGDIPYSGNLSATYTLEATYTQAIHDDIVAEFPQVAQGIAREGVFKSWILQEVGNGAIFWGNNISNYQPSPYRINEGGGDEEGSMGYNHIIWKRMYGAENSCESNRGFLTNGVENINLYHPVNSALAFLAAASDSACTYSRGLYNAYIPTQGQTTPDYVVAHPQQNTPLSYCYETTAPGDMVGPRCSRAGNQANWIAFNSTHDDGYNLLGKAVIAYNQGANANNLRNNSYFTALQGMPRRTPAGNFSPTHFGYWLGVKQQSWTIQADIGGYLPFVTYIWVGARYPQTDPVTGQPHPNAGQPEWCFAYGEKEWMAGRRYADVRTAAIGSMLNPAVGRIACQ